ncbi:MAG TPA: acyltransferase family protein [Beutenbergiaceae bacterium]|nr:acyltransferase family protein [Beutenbergiaceae bacterium]
MNTPEAAATGAGSPPSPRGRVLALDVARAVAIIGMLMVNVGPTQNNGVAGAILMLPHGRASLLFVLLAGIGLSLLTRRARRPGGRVDVPTVLWRAGLLLLIGLSTQLLDHDLNVILATYAALFVLALPFLRAPANILLTLALALAVFGPVVWLGVQMLTGTTFEAAPAALLDNPVDTATSILLTGPYPVITWAAPFLLGMWLGRLDLQRRSTAVRLIIIGAALAVAGEVISAGAVALWGEPGEVPALDLLLSSVAHSQTPIWLIGGTGAAAAVLGLCLLVVPRLGRWVQPLAATGQLALTVYVLHLVVIAVLVRPGPDDPATGLLVTAVLSLVLVALSMVWRTWRAQGPLEAALRLPRGRRDRHENGGQQR